MKKNGLKKIRLSKETLRVLVDAEILNVNGMGERAIGDESGSCAGPVCSVVSCPSAC